jgi:ADP-ribosylglycohydrolase
MLNQETINSEFTEDTELAVSLVNTIMTEEVERVGDDQATKALVNALIHEETEQNGKDEATMALVQALQTEDTKQAESNSVPPFSQEFDNKSFPPLKQ